MLLSLNEEKAKQENVNEEEVEVEETFEESTQADEDALALRNEDIYKDAPNLDIFRLLLDDISKYPLLSPEEEYNYAKQYAETGSKEAKDALVNHNMRLVINIAKHYKVQSIPLLDLIQEGSQGLMVAVDRFDYSRGYKFSTYATWWIKQAITRYIANNDNLIRVPVHMHEIAYKYRKLIEDYKKEYGTSEEPSDDYIMEKMNITEDKLKSIKALECNVSITSLDQPVGEEEDSVLMDFIPDSKTTEDVAISTDLSRIINELLSEFPEREQKVIRYRFGFYGRIYTLEEVGAMYGVTRERIRQIEAKVLRKLRHPKRVKLIKDFMNK